MSNPSDNAICSSIDEYQEIGSIRKMALHDKLKLHARYSQVLFLIVRASVLRNIWPEVPYEVDF